MTVHIKQAGQYAITLFSPADENLKIFLPKYNNFWKELLKPILIKDQIQCETLKHAFIVEMTSLFDIKIVQLSVWSNNIPTSFSAICSE